MFEIWHRQEGSSRWRKAFVRWIDGHEALVRCLILGSQCQAVRCSSSGPSDLLSGTVRSNKRQISEFGVLRFGEIDASDDLEIVHEFRSQAARRAADAPRAAVREPPP